MHVYIHIRIHIYKPIYVHVQIYIHIYIYIHICIYMYNTYIYMHMNLFIHIYAYVDKCILTHVLMRIYTYVYEYISFSGDEGEMRSDFVSAVNAHGSLQNTQNWSASDTEW